MAGRGHMPPPYARHHLPGPGMMWPEPFGPIMGPPIGPHPLDFLPPPEFLEHKIATQHAEMQRLASENQRLAATHVALRQELAAAQQELQRLQAHMAALQNDKDEQIRSILDKTAKMEAELLATESLKAELQQAHAEAQNLMSVRQELTAQGQQLNQELQRAHAEVQQVPAMHTELDGLRQEVQRARTAFEYEKAANSEQMEQIQAMEKNLVSMAREVEKLRAEIANVPEKRGRAASYGGAYNGPDASFSSVGQNMYGDGYGMSQMPVGPESVVPYAAGAGAAWGGYDVPRGVGSHVRR
eukprot:Gb_17540 [translate_table: standard]